MHGLEALPKWYVWYLACSIIKFVWNFAIYCGKSEVPQDVVLVVHGKPKLAHNLVVELSKDIQRKRHVLSMDNIFTSIKVLRNLALKSIYGTAKMRFHGVGFLHASKNMKSFNKIPQRTLDWTMRKF